jgi:outer membrane protein insertion porin family
VAGFVAVVLIGAAALQAQEDSRPRTIIEIRIEGLKREQQPDLLARLGIRVGMPFVPRRLDEEVGHLYATGKFSNVSYETDLIEDRVIVTFRVVERPVIAAVELRGRDALKEKHLLTSPPALHSRVGALFSQAQFARDRDLLRQKYHDAGYIFAQVDGDVQHTQTGTRVVFQIQEGSRVRIRKVEFVGNHTVPSASLLKLMSTREKDFWFFGLLRPGFYDHATLQADLENLKRHYWSLGFFDAHVELDNLQLDYGDGRLQLTIRVDENARYIFKGYSLEGNRVFGDQTLLDLTTAVQGVHFDARIMEKDRQSILDYYGDRAYIEAQVDWLAVPDPPTRQVRIDFDIVENNEVYVEQVKVRGNVKTQDRVIRREVEVYPGERVDRSKLVKSRSNLNRLQIFRSVRYRFEPGSKKGSQNLIWDVEEEPSGRLILGFGVTSGFGVIGNFSITKRNFDLTDLPDSLYDLPDSFTGAGQTLTLVAQPGSQRSLYRFSLTEPYLFGTRNALTISAASLSIIRDEYDEDRTTFAPNLAHAFDFDRDFVFTLGTRLEEVEISDIDNDAPADVFDSEGYTTVIAVNTGLRYDKVLYEHLEGPYSGSSNAMFYEIAGGHLGGEVDLHKVELTNQLYYPVYTTTRGPETLHHVISLTNRVGVIEPQHDGDDVPIFERFFLGGPNTVRGFRFRGLGPHENKDAIGGTGMVYGNLEYSFPLFQKVLRGVLFFDYGNLQSDSSDVSFAEMRYVIGGSARRSDTEADLRWYAMPTCVDVFGVWSGRGSGSEPSQSRSSCRLLPIQWFSQALLGISRPFSHFPVLTGVP